MHELLMRMLLPAACCSGIAKAGEHAGAHRQSTDTLVLFWGKHTHHQDKG
jgi:hypothetical protein